MTWSIARAKQHLSEVVRLAAKEPQRLYNRGRLVGALIDAESFRAFEQWRTESAQATVAEQFERIRAELAAQGEAGAIDGLPPAPERADRPNPFVRMLEEETCPARTGSDDATR
jgi:prevent-host-death family protein